MAHKKDEELGPKELARRQYMRAYRAANAEHLAQLAHRSYVQAKEERNAYAHAYYKEHAAAYKERAKQYRRANAEYLKGYWRQLKTGCSPELYAKLLAEQGGVCAICGSVDERELCADHDHVTGVVRGLLCRLCNLGIGKLRHSPAVLRAAADYLERE